MTRALDALALKHQERQGSPTAAEGEGAQEALARLLREVRWMAERKRATCSTLTLTE